MAKSKTPKKKYEVVFKFNGESVKTEADDMNDAILTVKPTQLHTEMYVTVKNGEQLVERRVLLIPARKIFQDAFHRQVFINNLLLQ